MKNTLFLLCLLLLTKYSNAQYLNEISVKLHQPQDLKKDVDLVQTTLEKENPNLYLYISKKALNYKFDSLRNSITKPLTSVDLYIKMLNVISYIGDGHLTINIDYSKLTPADMASLKLPAPQHPIYQFDYRVIKNQLFITKNLSANTSIMPGTEILSINNIPTSQVIDTLNHYITSDGYNTTFKQFLMNVGLFAERFRFLYAKTDSLLFKLQYHNSIQQVTIVKRNKPGVDSSAIVKPPSHAEYRLLTPDSNIAYLKVRTFVNGNDYVGYHGIFRDIIKRNIKTLVLDLRGNTGGETLWASSLFSSLIDTPTYFFRPPAEVMQQNLLYSQPKIKAWLQNASKYWFGKQSPSNNLFKGKLYVLINGGSFSATSLLAANIRLLKNVTFVGEETGGSKNIWTAGAIKNVILPTSKMILTYGYIPAYFGDIGDINGRGLMPDVPISYTIDDILANKDLEMEWVLNDVKKARIAK